MVLYRENGSSSIQNNRKSALESKAIQEITILRSEKPTRRGAEESELEKFKPEFKTRQQARFQEPYREKNNFTDGKRNQKKETAVLRRSPDVEFNKRVDQSPSLTEIVILKPSVDDKDVGNYEAGRKSTGSAEIGGYGFSKDMKNDLKMRTWSFRKGLRDENLSFNLGRCLSEPISGDVLRRVLLEEQGKPPKFELSQKKEKRRKHKKNFFKFKGRIASLRRALSLGRRLFRRKNLQRDEPFEITVISPSEKPPSKDNFTEVPPSPVSVSNCCENDWRPSLPSPISPLEMPFREDHPQRQDEISLLAPMEEEKILHPSTASTSFRHEADSNPHREETIKSNEENYLLRVLEISGFHNQPLTLILALCNSPTEPLAEWVFKEANKSTNHPNSSSRRLLFDLLNEQLLCLVRSPALDSTKIIPPRTGKELMKALWKRLERYVYVNKGFSGSLDSLIASDLRNPGIMIHGNMDDACEYVEGMVLSQLIEEFILDMF